MSIRRFTTVMLAGGALVAAGLVAPSPAFAVGGNCSANTEKQARSFQPDLWRVAASCSSLQADSKARGTLSAPRHVDYHTQWFTGLNTTYRSGWTTSIYGTPSARSEITHV